jgi:hypothetical protein
VRKETVLWVDVACRSNVQQHTCLTASIVGYCDNAGLNSEGWALARPKGDLGS